MKTKKKNSNVMNVISTVCLVLGTIVLFIALAGAAANSRADKALDAAPTGEEMMSFTLLYGIENVNPFDIVEDAAVYKAHGLKANDDNTNLALGLAQYREAALCRYAYDAVGDSSSAAKYQKRMDEAREQMKVSSYADYIDKNYENYANR